MSDSAAKLAARARELSHLLVGWPSVTGTPDEAAFAERLAEEVGALSYFREHPDHLIVEPVPDDRNGRASVIALVRGTGPRTVILSGHFDVVPVDDYGDLAPLAVKPHELREALVARLKETGDYPDALKDLKSGEFVPGRGMLDMKSGVAAGLAVLEQFAEQDERHGNLLLIATPDEEENSCGMRSVTAMLPEFLAAHGLDVALAINLDATCDHGDGAIGRSVTMGTIGKLLLSACVIGKDSHACYPFDGINAAYLAAEIAVDLECAPELSEAGAAPPTALSLKDGKTVYNVTLPGRSWLYFNVLHHRRSTGEIFEIARTITGNAIERAAERMVKKARATDYDADEVATLWSVMRVMTFAELIAEARKQEGFQEAFEAEAMRLMESSLDYPERSRILTEFVWDHAALGGNAVILGNASLPYPAVAWGESAEDRRTKGLVDAALKEIGQREGQPIISLPFFPAISDMSFLGHSGSTNVASTARNTPLWGSTIQPLPEDFGVPIINIGPWGRDYHHWLERTHADYTFRVLPLAVAAVAEKVLSAD